MQLPKLSIQQVNYLNIGLMIVSFFCALIRPFETFLFVYAFLGPLHYLTEISWLHDRNYFTKGKYDYLLLWTVGFLLSLEFFGIHLADGAKVIFITFLSSALLAFVKNRNLKLFGFAVVIGIAFLTFPTE